MQHYRHVEPLSLWLAGIVVLLLGVFASGCAPMEAQLPSQSHLTSATATPTSRPLRQNYVYLHDTVLLDGSVDTSRARVGQTLTITWHSHAYNQSADPSPITLSLVVYGPFASRADMAQRMQIGSGLQSTPAPLTQLGFSPTVSGPTIHADTWTTAAQTTTFRIPTSLSAGYYDVVYLSTAGSQVVERGDNPVQIG